MVGKDFYRTSIQDHKGARIILVHNFVKQSSKNRQDIIPNITLIKENVTLPTNHKKFLLALIFVKRKFIFGFVLKIWGVT
jgi:CRISPR/Cas system-associated endonuclease/helicase Cas3